MKKAAVAVDTTRILTMDKDVKFEFRLPTALKTALEEKAREKGYKHVSKYVLELLVRYGIK